MSIIKIQLSTDRNTGDIDISIKAECSLQEFDLATNMMMGKLAASSVDGMERLTVMMSDIAEAITQSKVADTLDAISHQDEDNK